MLPAPIDSPVDFGVPGQSGPSAAWSPDAQQVPHRTDVAVAGCPKNVPVTSARAATPLQPTSPKWLTVHRLGELLTAVVQKSLDDSIFRSCPTIFLAKTHQPSNFSPSAIMPSSYRLLRPQHRSASFLSSVEKNRKSSPRPLFISSTVLKAWHPIDSQGAATVRLLRVLLTSKASAKACS